MIKDLTKLISSFSGFQTDEKECDFFYMGKRVQKKKISWTCTENYKIQLAGLTLKDIALDHLTELIELMGKRFDTRLNQLQVWSRELAKAIHY